MEAKAKQSNVTMPARKLRRVINIVRGKSVLDAISMLKFMPYFAARVVEKNVIAAAANANEKFGISADKLRISEIYADESRTLKRGKARAQGRMYARVKRTSHITVVVASETK